MITIAQAWKFYKDWKKVKGAVKKVEGSGAYKVFMISNRVDQLILEYQRSRDAKSVDSIKARMRAIKEELTKLATAVPDVPKPSKDMAVKYAEAILAANNTAEMAQMELMRVYMEQLQGTLPEDDTNFWPVRRARLVSGRDAFRRASVGQLSGAVSVQKDIDAEQRQQSLLRKRPQRPGRQGRCRSNQHAQRRL